MKELKPELLSQVNIPKPLHGLNPRNIMGKDKWDDYRKDVYASTNFHCKACGVHKSEAKKHKWLEAHEDFDIDYRKKIMTLRQIIPLCHYCHSFIHSGFLYTKYQRSEINEREMLSILRHGFDILEKYDLRAFPFTIQLANHFGVSTKVRELLIPESFDWDGWKMIWDGEEYKSKFKTEKDWKRFYNR